MSQELDEEANEHTRQHVHHHTCSNLFGCGDEKGIGILREDIKERAFDNRASDRLLHMDEINQVNLDSYPRREDVGAASSCKQVASWAL